MSGVGNHLRVNLLGFGIVPSENLAPKGYKRAIEHCNCALSIATNLKLPLVQDYQALKEELLSQDDE